MCRFPFVTAATLLSLASTLPAQDRATTVVPGRLIRVQVVGGGELQGTVTATGASRLQIAVTGADTVTLLRTEVGRVELFQGMKSRVGKGALDGLIVGGISGAVLGLIAAGAQDQDEWFYISPAEYAIGSGLFFGALGAGIGALTGMHKRPVWKTVSLPTVFAAPASPGGGGVAVGLHLHF